MRKRQQMLLTFYEQLVIDFNRLPPPCKQELQSYEESTAFTRTTDWQGWPRKKPQSAPVDEPRRAAQ